MAKLDRSNRIAASALFLMAAAGPLLAWCTYLLGGNASDWRVLLESAMSAENDSRLFFILFAVAGGFSLASAIVVAVQRRRFYLRGVLIGGVIQTLAYAAVDAESAGILGIKVRAPLLEIRRVAMTFNDAPVEFRRSLINTEHYEYFSDLAKTGGG